jgi:hypothetical protein
MLSHDSDLPLSLDRNTASTRKELLIGRKKFGETIAHLRAVRR